MWFLWVGPGTGKTRLAVSEKRLSLIPQWQCALSIEDAIPRWHETCHLRAVGLHCPAGGAGAEAKSESHPFSWGVRAEQRR